MELKKGVDVGVVETDGRSFGPRPTSAWVALHAGDLRGVIEHGLAELGKTQELSGVRLPAVLFAHPLLRARVVLLRPDIWVAEIGLPAGGCSLLWMPCPAGLIEERELATRQGCFHRVSLSEERAYVQPRRTLCWGRSYTYSGTTHPMEVICTMQRTL